MLKRPLILLLLAAVALPALGMAELAAQEEVLSWSKSAPAQEQDSDSEAPEEAPKAGGESETETEKDDPMLPSFKKSHRTPNALIRFAAHMGLLVPPGRANEVDRPPKA